VVRKTATAAACAAHRSGARNRRWPISAAHSGTAIAGVGSDSGVLLDLGCGRVQRRPAGLGGHLEAGPSRQPRRMGSNRRRLMLATAMRDSISGSRESVRGMRSRRRQPRPGRDPEARLRREALAGRDRARRDASTAPFGGRASRCPGVAREEESVPRHVLCGGRIKWRPGQPAGGGAAELARARLPPARVHCQRAGRDAVVTPRRESAVLDRALRRGPGAPRRRVAEAARCWPKG